VPSATRLAYSATGLHSSTAPLSSICLSSDMSFERVSPPRAPLFLPRCPLSANRYPPDHHSEPISARKPGKPGKPAAQTVQSFSRRPRIHRALLFGCCGQNMAGRRVIEERARPKKMGTEKIGPTRLRAISLPVSHRSSSRSSGSCSKLPLTIFSVHLLFLSRLIIYSTRKHVCFFHRIFF
jgi:hypothetical protein